MYKFQYSWRVWTSRVQGRESRAPVSLDDSLKNRIEFERGSKQLGTSLKWLVYTSDYYHRHENFQRLHWFQCLCFFFSWFHCILLLQFTLFLVFSAWIGLIHLGFMGFLVFLRTFSVFFHQGNFHVCNQHCLPLQSLLTGKFLLTYREKKSKEKREIGWKLRRKEGKLLKGNCKIWNGSRKSYKNRWGPFFFFFCFSLLKTKEICFGCTKVGIFSTEKKHFMLGKKKSGKMTLPPPPKNMPVTPLNLTTKNSQKHDQLSHAMSDFCDPYFQYLPPNVGVWFAPKICVETCKPTWFIHYHVVQNRGSGHPDSCCILLRQVCDL